MIEKIINKINNIDPKTVDTIARSTSILFAYLMLVEFPLREGISTDSSSLAEALTSRAFMWYALFGEHYLPSTENVLRHCMYGSLWLAFKPAEIYRDAKEKMENLQKKIFQMAFPS